MRILQIGKFYPIRGGVEKVMWDLTRGLDAAGVRCDMLCASLSDGGRVLRFPGGGRVICVKALCKAAATMISPAMVRWLLKNHRNYDIIHIHHPDPMAALALRLSGFTGKVVLHWHSDILSQKVLLRLYGPLQHWLIGRADCIVGTTPVYLAASPYLKKVQDKCVTVPIGIAEMEPDHSGAEALRQRHPGKTLLLSIGRLVPYKGFSTLIEALGRLPERFHLLLGGIGPLEKELRDQVEKAGLGERVDFLGYIPQEQIPAYYGACDIYVLSSCLKTEAFGIVQLEAMSFGKPVVATRILGSGVSWVNADGVSGRNALPDKPESLAEAIVEVERNKETYGGNARERYLRLFTEDRMIKTMMSIYEKLM